MTKTVNVHEAKTHFSKLLERAHAGEEIVVAKAGKPYAKLVPLNVPTHAPRRLGGLGLGLTESELDESVKPLDDDELKLWP